LEYSVHWRSGVRRRLLGQTLSGVIKSDLARLQAGRRQPERLQPDIAQRLKHFLGFALLPDPAQLA
jgi:hypothetical protein